MSKKKHSPPDWLSFAAYLAYLLTLKRMTCPVPTTTDRVLVRLITIVGFVLVVLALVVIGAPDVVSDIAKNWPFLP